LIEQFFYLSCVKPRKSIPMKKQLIPFFLLLSALTTMLPACKKPGVSPIAGSWSMQSLRKQTYVNNSLVSDTTSAINGTESMTLAANGDYSAVMPSGGCISGGTNYTYSYSNGVLSIMDGTRTVIEKEDVLSYSDHSLVTVGTSTITTPAPSATTYTARYTK